MSASTMPAVVVTAGGTALTGHETRGLEEVRVQQRLSLPAQCELAFSDPPGPLATAERLLPGTELRVDAGDGLPLFRGEVTALEQVYGPAGQRQVRVRGYDRLHRLRKRQPVQARVQMTVVELARELTRDLGLRVEAPGTEGPFRPWLIQHRRSDLQLLAELAAEAGLYLALRGETLHLVTLAGLDEPEVPLALGQTLFEARLELNAEPACRSVRAAGWDPLRVEPHSGQASTVRGGRQVAAEASPKAVGGSAQRSSMGQLLYGDDHARATARAELERRVAYEVALWGVTEGNARLRPGTPVRIGGVAQSMAGRYVLTAVTHTIDNRRDFTSEISTLPPLLGMGEDALGGVAVLGVVIEVDDPRHAGRLRARLPGLGDVETDWMPVVLPGAGPDKGLVALPDVNDRVLVLLPNGEAGAGVVLGGLYGMGGPPDDGVDGNAVRRYTFATRGGQRVVLDDKKQVLRLEDATGNVVELSENGVRISAKGELALEAPGRQVTIAGDQIDFKRK